MHANKAFPDIAELVPHRRGARLLTAVASASPQSIEATGVIPPAHPLANGGRAPAFLAIEIGAQAAAAMEAIARREAAGLVGGARPGRLVRIRDARFERDWLPVSTAIAVAAELIGAAGPLAIYQIRASVDGALVVEAVISTHAGPTGDST
jgi:predicted hotdog family 3-hydroxylacyl-ACP dehydratase